MNVGRYEFVAGIGPLRPNWGRSTWNFLLAPEAILAWRYRFLEAQHLDFHLKWRTFSDPGAPVRSVVGLMPLQYLEKRRLELWTTETISTIKCDGAYVDIRFVNGGEAYFNYYGRADPERSRKHLQAIYPRLVDGYG